MKNLSKILVLLVLCFSICIALVACCGDDGDNNPPSSDNGGENNGGTEDGGSENEGGSETQPCQHEDVDWDSLCDKCGESYSAPHTHSYTAKNLDDSYLVSAATCESYAAYFYSCECGEKGSETFFDRYSVGHSFIDGICEHCSIEGTPGLVYTLVDGEYTVAGANEDEIQIIIPPTYNGIPVTAIADNAFKDCKNLLSVEIGRNVVSISDTAFDSCEKLYEIVLKSENRPDNIPADIEVQNDATKLQRMGDFWFYQTSDTDSMLVHYSGEASRVTLPKKSPIDLSKRILLPQIIAAEDFENTFLLPAINQFRELVEKYLKDSNPETNFDFFSNDSYEAYSYGFINCNSNGGLIDYLEDMRNLANTAYRNGIITRDEHLEIYSLHSDMMRIFLGSTYALFNPLELADKHSADVIERLYNDYPIIKEGVAIYVYVGSNLEVVRQKNAELLLKFCPEYNYETLVAQEKKVGVNITESYSIYNLTFLNSKSVAEIFITSGEIYISAEALKSCENLTYIHLANDVRWSFKGIVGDVNKILGIKVDGSNELYTTMNGSLYTKDKKELVQCVTTAESFVIPNGVVSIGEFAFANYSSLKSITIPNSVTSIGDSAFAGCSSLTSITIPDSVASVGDKAFADCESITSVTIGKGVTSIGAGAFADFSVSPKTNENIQSVYITDIAAWCNIDFEDEDSNPISNGAKLYLNSELVTNLVIPTGITTIKGYAFYNYYLLTSITIPSTITSVGENAFTYSYRLVEIINHSSLNITAGSEENGSIARYAKTVHTGESLMVEKGDYFFITIEGINYLINYIGNDNIPALPESYDGKSYVINDFAFCSNKTITSIVIPDSVTSIGDEAFSDCTSLKNIYIGDGVISIGSYACSGSYQLKTITIGKKVASIGTYALSSKPMRVGNLVAIINHSNLEISQDDWMEYGTNNYTLILGDEYDFVTQDDYIFVTVDGVNYLLNYIGTDTVITLPESFAGEKYAIYDGVFYEDYKITSVTIPDNVTSIGNEAFALCNSLTDITIGKGITYIGEEVFYTYFSSLTNVHITDIAAWCDIDFEHAGSNPLCFAKNLYLNGELVTDLVVPEGVSAIKDYTFYGCDCLTSVTIPSSVTEIGDWAFHGCYSLTSVYITDIVAWCNIDFVAYDSNPLYCGANLYLNGNLVTNLVIPEGVTAIKNYAFYNCDSLTSITIPNSVTYIGSSAFSGCSSLTCITIPDSVTSIGDSAFYKCSSLTSINYSGTKAEWKAISKGYDWNYSTGSYTVYCSDGNLTKEEA